MRIKNLIFSLALALSLVAAGVALANDGVEQARWVVGGGTSDSEGGEVTLRATLGQPIVGIVTNAGGDITLGQGFWHGGITPAADYKVYLPVVLRNH